MAQRGNETRFEQVLAPVFDLLTTETAPRIASVRVSRSIQRRLDILARKANFGTLTEAERAEHLELIEALDLLAIFKAKARLVMIKSQRT